MKGDILKLVNDFGKFLVKQHQLDIQSYLPAEVNLSVFDP